MASAVMYVKFALDETAAVALRRADTELAIVIDHPALSIEAPIRRALKASLVEDLT